ncbi:MAG: hypothetical protein ACI9SC_000108 [Gammaproteobacteria bacterium]|jgi:hypothetical protein
MRYKSLTTHRGQALTEFLICASFALIPLLLGISMLAKYIDIKQAAVQAARYEAWEYSVWYAKDDEMMTGFGDGDLDEFIVQPKKSIAETQAETRRRFYTDPSDEVNTLLIRDSDSNTDWTVDKRNRFWVDHRGNRLYSGVAGGVLDSSDDTPTVPIIGDIMNLMLDILDWAFSAIGTLISFVGGSQGFSAINTDGYATSTTALVVPLHRQFVNTQTLTGPANVNMSDTELSFGGSASVLTDGWNAGGVAQTYNQAAGTVPTTLLKLIFDAPVIRDIWSIVTVLAPELRTCNPTFPWPDSDSGSLWFGYIDIDAVHPDRLSGGGREIEDPNDASQTIEAGHVCNDAGMCDFTPALPRRDDLRECEPNY